MSTIQRITTDLDLRALASRILDLDRTRSILIATTPTPTTPPTIDTKTLTAGLSDDHELWVVTADRTRLLEQLLGTAAGVYGGAVRIYPAGEAPDAGYVWLPQDDTTAKDMARAVLDALAPAPQPDPAETSPQGVARTAADGARVADQLLHPDRRRPLMLLSVPAGHSAPWADVDELRDTTSDWCDLVIIHTGPATHALAARLPKGCEAFGGAGRVYPAGTAWLHDWDAAPLRLCYDADGAEWLTRTLIHDAWNHAPATLHTSHGPQPQVEGSILGIVGSRGLVRLDTGTTATIWPETLVADVDADQLLVAGMRVAGIHHETSGRLDIAGMLTDPATALTNYTPGSQVLVRARHVTDPDLLPVELLPGTTGTIARHLVTTSTWPLQDLVSPGEVLVARILTTQPWTLTLDIDDHAPLHPAPAILTGGPAWLTPPFPDPEPTALPTTTTLDEQLTAWAETDEPLTAPGHTLTGDAATQASRTTLAAAIDTPTTDTEALPAGWQIERDQLADQLRREKAKTSQAREQARAAKTRLRAAVQERDQARAALASLQADTGRVAADSDLFTDPVEQLRFEIGLAWARRIPAAQKRDLPLRPYTVGDSFLPSLEELHGLDRNKVVDVAVEVLTGLAAQLDSRELHPLRTGDAGNAPARTRDDGAVAWRCAVQRGTASARRFHYWQLPDGSIELASVRLHDDIRL